MLHLHVLLVEGDAETRRTVKASLGRDPFFTLRYCASGAQALTAAVAWRPDLILLEVKKSEMNGLNVVDTPARRQAHGADTRRVADGIGGISRSPAFADDRRRRLDRKAPRPGGIC